MEQNVFAPPRMCAFDTRRALERMVKRLYEHDGGGRKPVWPSTVPHHEHRSG